MTLNVSLLNGGLMLVLTRKKGDSITIANLIEVKILKSGKHIRVGIKAPNDINIVRTELLNKEHKHKNT